MKPHIYFNRSADTVAESLIGAVLHVRDHTPHIITETEAYMGPHDLACHASRGLTPRTEILYRDPGTIYVYVIYGIHTMLNIVTGPRGFPAGVLIRGEGPYDGPGKLTRALGITHDDRGHVLGDQSGIRITPRTQRPHIERTPRIGIDYAGAWKDAPLRFVMK